MTLVDSEIQYETILFANKPKLLYLNDGLQRHKALKKL